MPCAPLFNRNHRLNTVVLRTSRFFPEEDDNAYQRAAYTSNNLKAIEFLYRRVELEDVVSAHLAAAERANRVGFGRFVISATTPFQREDLTELRTNAAAVVERIYPHYTELFARHNYRMVRGMDRVYDNALAREQLGWAPKYDFAQILETLRSGEFRGSAIAQAVGSKGYHDEVFIDGPYPTQ